MNIIIKSLNFLLKNFGYRIRKYNPDLPGVFSPQADGHFMNLYKIVKANTMLSIKRLYSLHQLVKYIDNRKITGDFIECGVWKGGAMGMVAATVQKPASRRLLLFDAFDDICQPDAAVDGKNALQFVKGKEHAQGKLESVKGVYDYKGGHGTRAACEKLLVDDVKYERSLIQFYEGWFQDTFPNAVGEVGDVAILRIDADWYASTKICLDYFYDKVVDGGIIIIDDYGTYDGCKKAVDEFIDTRRLNIVINNVDDECIYWIKN